MALGSCVYLWDATTGEIHLLHEMDNVGGDYISCVNWTMDGNHLALGISNGTVEVFEFCILYKFDRSPLWFFGVS